MSRLAKLRARARARLSRSRGGRAFLGLGGRTGHMALGVGTGAIAQVASEMATDKVSFLRSNWYGGPAILGAGAFLMIRKKPTVAYALAGAAGYAAAFNYKLNAFQQGKRASSPVPVFGSAQSAPVQQLAPGVPQTKAYDDAGAWADPVGF